MPRNVDDYHVQKPFKTFVANRWALCREHMSVHERFWYFDPIVTPIAPRLSQRAIGKFTKLGC